MTYVWPPLLALSQLDGKRRVKAVRWARVFLQRVRQRSGYARRLDYGRSNPNTGKEAASATAD